MIYLTILKIKKLNKTSDVNNYFGYMSKYFLNCIN